MIVFGHTHVVEDTKAGDVRHSNTGTWADALPGPPEIVHGAPVEALEKLVLFARGNNTG